VGNLSSLNRKKNISNPRGNAGKDHPSPKWGKKNSPGGMKEVRKEGKRQTSLLQVKGGGKGGFLRLSSRKKTPSLESPLTGEKKRTSRNRRLRPAGEKKRVVRKKKKRKKKNGGNGCQAGGRQAGIALGRGKKRKIGRGGAAVAAR